MRIDLYFSPTQIDELQLRDKNIVVIDVLRASTTIAMALSNGAKEIIPVSSVESAVKISGSLFGDVILRGGERNGKIIEGFNLGNSPQEYIEEVVKGKSIIFTSTNGSLAMTKARYAKNMAVGGFVNVSKIVEFIKGINSDFIFICAGNQPAVGGFCVEDAVCAGMVIQKLQSDKSISLELSDAALASLTLFKKFGRSILKMIKNSEHGKYLKEIGFANDLRVCAGVDTIPVLPVLSGNVIKLKKEDEQKILQSSDKSAQSGIQAGSTS